MTKPLIIGICIGIPALSLVFIASQLLWLKFNGTPVPRPEIPRGAQTIGTGPVLTYVVLGDSTSISQGGEYTEGYAAQSAAHLAKTHTVTWLNAGVSGATAQDVASEQVARVLKYKPDVVLIAVGANDVTHRTTPKAVVASLEQTISKLRAANSQVRIVLTGSPDMGSPPRIPQPLRWIAGKRTVTLNKDIVALTEREGLVFAPIAAKTGPTFRKHPELFAADNFHPTTEGYRLWTPVITDALDQALQP
ncbi:MAG TPA: SGNH/GDSL hydrolase family protein [Candidatus Saccharimonadales bacterium]|nr:SGNH/GDSL hydrolase family protein [Candidatus Saccharimonadales bacterium]